MLAESIAAYESLCIAATGAWRAWKAAMAAAPSNWIVAGCPLEQAAWDAYQAAVRARDSMAKLVASARGNAQQFVNVGGVS